MPAAKTCARLSGILFLSYFLGVAPIRADTHALLSTIEVRAQKEDLSGQATSGSEGIVSGQRLASVPLSRPAEALEMVPGLIVTQHAGDGKANQYFLRGFNLDHGTDFATWVGGVPVNMPTHAHGQGYTDLNFLIPELVDRIRFRKGPYFAAEGDFSSAGVARIDYLRRMDGPLALVTAGQNAYARTLLADSPKFAQGHLLYALELFHNDGPWVVPENYRKVNGVLRYSQGSGDDGFAVTGMAYRGRWTSTDQLAQRAIDDGRVGRYGTLDDSTGGETFRYSLSAEWARRVENSQSTASIWGLRSGLDLWSNFQYCLNDYALTGTCATGDQFKQSERRVAGGFSVAQTYFSRWAGMEVANAFGVDARIDRIDPVGLQRTRRRETWSTVREDRVTQRSLSFWLQNETRWSDWFRTQIGARGDSYDFTVDARLAANSGQAADRMLTPKVALILEPWQRTEVYLNYGQGFHSNDARGTTIRVDPSDGVTPVAPVSPLVRTTGYEAGLRSEPLRGWQTTLALWQLNMASELLFVGDAGTTEASRPSRRYGVEWSNFYAASSWLSLDADFAWSHARFSDSAAEGSHIPGAVATTANFGVTVDHLGPWFGALRFRYIGPRPLNESNSVRSGASALTNLRVGYRIDSRLQLVLEVFNVFDREVNDIEYWYDSQLPGERTAVSDRHVHSAEPRTARLTLSWRF